MRRINRNRTGNMKQIRSLGILLLVAMMVFTGCSAVDGEKEGQTNESGEKIDIALSAEEAARTEVMNIGTKKVYLDEVRYYSYNTQATYETYYIAEEKELDWNREMSEGVTLEEAVKSTVLDGICRRESLILYADEYNVDFTEEELKEIAEKVENFYEKSNEKILDRININRERLQEIFEKNELYNKVKDIMESEKEGKSDEVYKNWKKANNVTTNEYWTAINFQTPIFE